MNHIVHPKTPIMVGNVVIPDNDSLSLSLCRDAEDAVYGRDGYDYDGYRLRVEFPRSGRGGGRGGGGGGALGAARGRYGPPSRRSEYRVIVSGR